jgi:hypothetical protein
MAAATTAEVKAKANADIKSAAAKH